MPEVRNISAEAAGPMTGSTIRHNEREKGGKFRAREARIVGPLNKPSGPGGFDSVTGEFIPGVRRNDRLHDMERVTASPYFTSPDYSRGVAEERKSHRGAEGAHELLNWFLTSPAHTTGGQVPASDGIPNIFGDEEIG